MPNANKKKVGTLEFSCKICITEHDTNAYITYEQNMSFKLKYCGLHMQVDTILIKNE